jgi:glutathione S-transferase
MGKALIFYTNPMSRRQIVRWMLEEVGVDYMEEIIE